MAKELLIHALRGERVEQTPWLPHIGTHAAQLLDVSAERYLQDAGNVSFAKGWEKRRKS